MKVINPDVDIHSARFCNLTQGDLFQLKGVVYMKTDRATETNAVRLVDGTLCDIHTDDIVRLLGGTLWTSYQTET